MDLERETTRPLLRPLLRPHLLRSNSSVTDPVGLDLEALANLLQPSSEFAITRDHRKMEAKYFLETFGEFQHDYPVIQAYTSVLAEHSWSDKWLGITWVALQGIDSMCVVVRKDDLLNLRAKLCSRELNDPGCFYRMFWNAIISNVEDIEDFKLQGGNHMIPFSVVTVCPSMYCNRSGGQGSRAEYLAKKTSKFLQDEMKSGATFTHEKTVETAISALEHLFCRKIKAHKIRAFVWKKGEIAGREMPLRRKIPDLEELLADMRAENDDVPPFWAHRGIDWERAGAKIKI